MSDDRNQVIANSRRISTLEAQMLAVLSNLRSLVEDLERINNDDEPGDSF